MSSASDLKFIVERLSAPPFSKTWSVIQLHDEIAPIQLLQTVSDIVASIDQSNPQSPHRNVDLRNEQPEDTVARLSEFSRMLKFKLALANFDDFKQKLFETNRATILDLLLFLLKDIQTHKKRAYLALFLSLPEIPSEFTQDEVIMDLSSQIDALQEEFKNAHKWLEGIKISGNNASTLKKEIQQLEEEKQQVLNKVNRLKKSVEGVTNRDQWLQAAKDLRSEQQRETELNDKIQDQKRQVSLADKKLNFTLQSLKDVKAMMASSTPEAFFSKMEEDNRMNRFLANENMPKMLEEAKNRVTDLKKILSQPAMTDRDLTALEDEINQTNLVIAQLAERKMSASNTNDANLALFRQQASIISRKKEGAAQKLALLTEEVQKLDADWESKQELLKSSSGTKMLKGEEFKRYVSELRGKSTTYKRKKAEIASLTAEYGILERTEVILKSKEAQLQEQIHAVEKKSGVVGYNAAQETLEKVSEKKSEVDEEKGKTLNEISDIIQTLMKTIEDKKTMLAPVIQELRALRQEAQDVELEYTEKKRAYDAAMIGIETESSDLQKEVRGYRQDIINYQDRFHYLSNMIRMANVAQDRVMFEMKSYIGGDEVIEMQQKARGFKSYRDLYNKKITEHEHQIKILKEQQKDVKAKQEPNLKQASMFKDLQQLLQMKLEYNQKILSGATNDDTGVVTMDRLVL